jgi:hypothetical protein
MADIWTREGKVALSPRASTAGVTREERICQEVDHYTRHLAVDEREPMTQVYLRAYRRAGLIPGNADENMDCLPVAPVVKEDDPATATPPDPPTSAHGHTRPISDGPQGDW